MNSTESALGVGKRTQEVPEETAAHVLSPGLGLAQAEVADKVDRLAELLPAQGRACHPGCLPPPI